MTPENDDELLLNVPANPVENAQTYVTILSLVITWWFVR
jgi:hypothetical protein